MKMALLLACLAAEPGRQFSRDELIARLWPDDPVETAQNNLRVTLHRLRTVLGKEVLETTRRFVWLVPGTLMSDVAAFEDAVRNCHWREAKRWYGGPYLPGIYDDATLAERERLEKLYEDVCSHLASPGQPPASLPKYLTRFLCRETEQAEIARLLDERRLVTIVGPGGVGKTRLATELAASQRERFDGIVFVALAECLDASELPEHLRRALPISNSEDPTNQVLQAFFRDRAGLLVLDNVEQLVESGVAESIEMLLAALPTLRCLVTSRCPLGLEGEQLYPLKPLIQEHAIELFVDRARSVCPDFRADDSTRGPLTTLCRRLDGIPFALELAASHAGSLCLTEILRQLERDPTILAHPHKSGRQASVQETIAWSWRLLPQHLRGFLACLSVFRGGWSLPAAVAVCDRQDGDRCLDALRRASLVVREDGASGSRYHLLELIRTFAAAQLPDALRQDAEARHRRFFVGQAGEEDTANVLAALRSAVAVDDGEVAEALFLSHAFGALKKLGIAAVLEAGRAILALPSSSPLARLRVLSHLTYLADAAGDTKLVDSLLTEARRVAGTEQALRARLLAMEGQIAVSRNTAPETAIPPLKEALRLAEESGDTPMQATILRRLGILLLRNRCIDEAEASFTLSGKLFTQIGDATGARYALGNRAHALAERGDLSGALALYELCLERSQVEQDRLHETQNLLNIGSLQASQGRWKEALEAGRACLQLCRATGNLRTMANAFWNLPEPLLRLGEGRKAATLMHFAERFWLDHFEGVTANELAYRDKILTESGAGSDAREVGNALSLEEALHLALG
jgi:predicted ATPase